MPLSGMRCYRGLADLSQRSALRFVFVRRDHGRKVDFAVSDQCWKKGFGPPVALATAALAFAASAAGATSCLAGKSCTFDGMIYSSGTTWKCDCNVCGCDDGTVSSTGALCIGDAGLDE
jgi:hypothetical protein